MATFAIGDIQGCYASLMALLERCGYRAGKDRLWLTGDLINRGPRSLEVLRWVIAAGDKVETVLGNHDLHFLARALGRGKPKKRDTLDDALEAPDVGDFVEWLRHRPFTIRDGNRLMVHAGLHPRWTLAETEELARAAEAMLQRTSWAETVAQWDGKWPEWRPGLTGSTRVAAAVGVMTHIRMLDRDGELDRDFKEHPSDAPKGHRPWFVMPDRPTADVEIVCGHWAALGLKIDPGHLLAIDTGCVWGTALTAVRLDDGKVFTQPAIDGTGDRPSSPS